MSASLRTGERRLVTARRVGDGRVAFDTAASGMLAWRMHALAGVHVRSREGRPPAAASGLVVSVRLGPSVLRLAGLCRVEHVVVGSHEVSLTYRTLAEHVEDGVQTFRVVLRDDGAVEGAVESRSRARHPVLGRAGLVGTLGQQLVAERYLNALERLARAVHDGRSAS